MPPRSAPRPPRAMDRLSAAVDRIQIATGEAGAGLADRPHDIPVDRIKRNPHQPRTHFDQAEIDRLAKAIEAEEQRRPGRGLLQPISVIAAGNGDYFLVFGERRWRAVTSLGWPTIRAYVQEMDLQDLARVALLENELRQDLNAIERMNGYLTLQQQFKMTHEQLAAAFGQERTEITKILGLARLRPEIREAILDGTQTASTSALVEISACDQELQDRLWQALVSDGASVQRLRRLKQEFSEGAGESVRTTTASTGRGDALARYFVGFSRRLEDLTAEVRDDPAALSDERRSELLLVRDRINALLAKEHRDG